MLTGRSLKSIEAAIAIEKLEAGPADATRALSLLGLAKFKGLTGVGLAQPKIKPGLLCASKGKVIKSNGTKMVPIGSICAVGLSVTLPSSLAVGSPSRLAKYA